MGKVKRWNIDPMEMFAFPFFVGRAEEVNKLIEEGVFIIIYTRYIIRQV